MFREELKDKPSELKRYEDKLKAAIMMRNRSDPYHRKGKKGDNPAAEVINTPLHYYALILTIIE